MNFHRIQQQDSVSQAMSGMAAHLQQQAMQIAQESNLVDSKKAEVAELQRQLQEATQQNNELRRHLLTALRSRHGVELELMKVQDRQKERKQRTEICVQETREFEEKTTRAEEEFEEAVNNTYAPQKAMQEIYAHAMKMKLRNQREAKKRRDQQLSVFRRKTDEMNHGEETMNTKMGKFKREIEQFNMREEPDDEVVSGLAMQIKATLTNRAAQRKTLREVKHARFEANEKMVRWEHECMG
mmetsp:Transcript_9198/g.13420  ORF Transcript_9198/g.13420 Transcript_9198/m.13420 type:complete len:241 (-) Transcript_9198:187-909(-)